MGYNFTIAQDPVTGLFAVTDSSGNVISRSDSYSNAVTMAAMSDRSMSASEQTALLKEGKIAESSNFGRYEVDSAGNRIESQKSPPEDPGSFATAPTNAEKATANDDAGTDAPVKTGNDTQATPPIDPNSSAPQMTQQAGQCTATDDQISIQTNATRTRINEIYGSAANKIVAQPNALAKYASYTYSLSLYILTPDDLTVTNTGLTRSSATWNLPNSQLLIQSGGISTSDRNQVFKLDYYIDDLVLEQTIKGKGSGVSHNVDRMTFKVLEPNGFSFIKDLSEATYKIAAGGKSPRNYGAQQFLLSIRFYGYDTDGNQVTASGANTSGDTAIIVKNIPFLFTAIKFQASNSAVVTYNCEAQALPYAVAGTSKRGAIPYNIEVTGSTLGELTKSFAEKLTEFQKDAAKKCNFKYWDTYEVRIPEAILRDALVVAPNQASGLASVPMAKGPTAPAADQLDGEKITTDRKSKKASATAGQSIAQWLDIQTRTSQYIQDQQKFLTDIDKNGNPVLIPNGSPANIFSWFQVIMSLEKGEYDPVRKDHVYKIIYTIAPYAISYIDSEYFPNGQYRGVHKEYNYWFTGQNTEVLNYQIDYNYTYYLAVNAPQVAEEVGKIYNWREYHKKSYQPTTDQTTINNPNKVNDGSASAAAILYSPADNALARLQILGDPAWIQNIELSPDFSAKEIYDPFNKDGSINFNSQTVLMKVQFNTPADYNLNTGLMIPNKAD